MARRVLLRLSLAGLVAGAAFPLATSNAQASDSWLVSESEAKGDADLKLDMAAAKRALGGDQASPDAQKRMTKAMSALVRSYPGRNRLFDSSEAPSGAVDVTVPFIDLVQLGGGQPAATTTLAQTPPPPRSRGIIVGGAIEGVPGAVWADGNGDGQADGFIYERQYYAIDEKTGLASLTASGGSPGGEQYAAEGEIAQSETGVDTSDLKAQIIEHVQDLIGKLISKGSKKDDAEDLAASAMQDDSEGDAAVAARKPAAMAVDRAEDNARSQHLARQDGEDVGPAEAASRPSQLPPGRSQSPSAAGGNFGTPAPAATAQTVKRRPSLPSAQAEQTVTQPVQSRPTGLSPQNRPLPSKRIQPVVTEQTAPMPVRRPPPSVLQQSSPSRRVAPPVMEQMRPPPQRRTAPSVMEQMTPSPSRRMSAPAPMTPQVTPTVPTLSPPVTVTPPTMPTNPRRNSPGGRRDRTAPATETESGCGLPPGFPCPT